MNGMDDKDAAEDRHDRPRADKEGTGAIWLTQRVAAVLLIIGNLVTAEAVR